MSGYPGNQRPPNQQPQQGYPPQQQPYVNQGAGYGPPPPTYGQPGQPNATFGQPPYQQVPYGQNQQPPQGYVQQQYAQPPQMPYQQPPPQGYPQQGQVPPAQYQQQMYSQGGPGQPVVPYQQQMYPQGAPGQPPAQYQQQMYPQGAPGQSLPPNGQPMYAPPPGQYQQPQFQQPMGYPAQMHYQQPQQPPLLDGNQVNHDVQLLRNAMKGMGCDESAVIAVIGKRSPVQMQQVSQAFKAALGRDLVDDLRKETSGNFGRLAVDMAIPLAEFDASCVQQAVAGFGTNEGLLIEVLSGRSNMEINAIKAAYQKLYRRDLEREVANDLAGHLRRFFIGLVQGQRDETGQVLDISGDVQSLYQAGEGKWGTDESAFFMILNTRSENHIRAVMAAYQQQYGKTLSQVIKSEFTGDLERSLLALVSSIENRPKFLAERFERAMSGLGTKDEMLIRLAVRCRDPTLMHAIKQAYQAQYGKSLNSRIAGETSGDYEKLLLAIIGP